MCNGAAGALSNLNTLFANLMNGGNTLLHDAQAALPPMPTLPAGLPVIALPVGLQAAQPVTTVQASG